MCEIVVLIKIALTIGCIAAVVFGLIACVTRKNPLCFINSLSVMKFLVALIAYIWFLCFLLPPWECS